MSYPFMFRGRSKYGSTRVEIDGIKFASKREAKRYQELKLLSKAGKIFDLQLQKKFVLCPKFQYGGRGEREISYVADFVYLDGNANKIVEDVKGFRTEVYKIKRKLFLSKYGNNYIFREVK